MKTEFRRIAIVNRGDAAMRFVQAVQEYNQEFHTQLRTLALFTEPDRHALFVREADEAFTLGPAIYVDAADGERKNSYLNHELLAQALRASAAEAVWVGWGFVAEQAAFAELCQNLGLVFIGPGVTAMRNLGDKITAKKIAGELGIPVIPWQGAAAQTLAQAREHAEQLGYPVIIKSSAGGGGRGIRTAVRPEQLAAAYAGARSESLKVFGDPTVFVERLLTGVRHLEVQILADQHGTIWPLGVRDCSVQRRHQKILEEAPAPKLRRSHRDALADAAVRLCQSQGYVNCGNVEFLLDSRRGEFWFMEVNTRLQVEHAVTELTTGLDLVKLQIHVARGGKLEGKPPRPAGHAIEVRLNAEDPAQQFTPAPGTVEVFRLPSGPGVRVDTGLADGGVVPPEFDSMIGRIIAHGRDRSEALARLQRALLHTSVVITGGMSNKGFLTELLGRPEVERAHVEVGWLDGLVRSNGHLSGRHAEVALVLAAIKAYLAEFEQEKSTFFASAHRGRPLVRLQNGVTVKLVYQGQSYSLHVLQLEPHRFRVQVQEHRLEILAERLDQFEWKLAIGGRSHRVFSLAEQPPFVIEVDGVPHRIGRDDEGLVKAPAPAVVVSVLVKEGDTIGAGERVAVLEAMKMEMTILAPAGGSVKQIFVRQNQQVNAGAALLSLELGDHNPVPATAGRAPLQFAALAAPVAPPGAAAERWQANLAAIKSLLLGFDGGADDIKRLLAERRALAASASAESPEWWQQEIATLTIVTDLLAVFRRAPLDESRSEGNGRSSAEEYLHAYLRNTKAGSEGLPPRFVNCLLAALAHHGVTSLADSPELDRGLFRLARSHQRLPEAQSLLASILERHLEHMPALQPLAGPGYRDLLDRLINETQGLFPEINDLAREVRYRYCDQPLLDESRHAIYQTVEAHLDYLQQQPQAADREQRIQEMVDCPQPLNQLLSRRIQTADFEMRGLILEVMNLRFYRIRELRDFRREVVAGRNLLRAWYEYEGTAIELISCHADYGRLADFLASLSPLLADIPESRDVVMDFYVWQPDFFTSRDEAADLLAEQLNRAPLPRRIRRAVFVVSGLEAPAPLGDVEIYTFRQSENGFQEERVYRGLHPMMGKRLQVWRLSNFAIERLPSVEDVYLFKGVAHDNPSDQRLFAFAEVRNMTVVARRSEASVHLPQLEWMLHETLAAMRRYQAALPVHQRLHWNRVLLYVWPVFELDPARLQRIIAKLAAIAEGQGIEKVVASVHVLDPETGRLRDVILDISNPAGGGVVTRFRTPSDQPIRTLSDYDKKVVQLRRRGMVYPYDLIRMLTPEKEGTHADYPAGEFVEYDLAASQALVPVSRPAGQNQANIVVGVLRNFTAEHPEGMARVALLGDPSKAMGALAEPECRRIIAGLDLAEQLGVPLEWYALSAGALISMSSGTENMDWIARVLRRIIAFTQAGGEINVVVTGINVGAQPYWNAEATMLMHTRGILIMTPQSAMVLTGKQALEYSGGVAAEDNEGIGGYERVMGPNGQAQYFAADVGEACRLLLRYYEHAYRAPGERFPRPARSNDPLERDVRLFPHGGEFEVVGDIFSSEKNPGRKKPFDIRKVMRATIDQDHPPLERWLGMRDAEIAVVWEAHLGGQPVCLLGFESRPLPRLGIAPADGPATWTGGTLFPQSSKKIARALNAASNNRPLVVLANLSGFDGSPESLRNWQLEYGAEIGRAVVNFQGPIVFCVISRYHGGAFVVFSNALNDNMEVVALEGSYASVIGGAPAAAVVFARDVDKRTRADRRLTELEQRSALAQGAEKVKLRNQWQEVYQSVYSEKLGEVAEEFDTIHSIERAQRVGSVNTIIPAARLRPYLIEAVRRGMQRSQAG